MGLHAALHSCLQGQSHKNLARTERTGLYSYEWLDLSPDLNPLDYTLCDQLEMACSEFHQSMESPQASLRKAVKEFPLEKFVQLLHSGPKVWSSIQSGGVILNEQKMKMFLFKYIRFFFLRLFVAELGPFKVLTVFVAILGTILQFSHQNLLSLQNI